jgi:hypothetical protein
MVLKGHSHGKVVEMTSLYHRFGPNQGMAMIFKFLKSPIKKLQLFMWGCKMGSLDLQEVAAARTQNLYARHSSAQCLLSVMQYAILYVSALLTHSSDVLEGPINHGCWLNTCWIWRVSISLLYAIWRCGAAGRFKNTKTYAVCHSKAANLCKSGELFFTSRAASLKNRNNTTDDFKNLKSVGIS